VALAPGPEGDVLAAGSGDALTSFAGGPPLGGRGESDAYLARIGADGQVGPTVSFGGEDDDGIDAVSVLPGGDVVIGGRIGSAVVIHPGELGETVLEPLEGSSTAGFVARFTAEGALVWAETFGGSSPPYIAGVTYDPVSHVVILVCVLFWV
jgi:hypothetical protein